MQAATKKRIIEFLEMEKENLLKEWSSQILVSENDPFKDKVRENGEAMYTIVLAILSKTDEELEKYIKNLAFIVGDERVKANINIGEFVYNVNVGRSIIYKFLARLDKDLHEIQAFIEKINYCFDHFLYYAVSHYTEAKNKIIEEKNQFIDSTHKDRLTLLGQMTSSFIHEFRNPLTSIQGFVQLLKSEHKDMKYLDIISNELEQLNFRISQFLLLSKKELIGKEKTNFCLNQLLDEVLNFLYPSILDAKVRIIKEMHNESIQMCGYKDEIRQVFINIIFNAIDVLSQYREDPRVEICSSKVDNTQIKIEIINNGPKIPDILLKSIFEPFVTTKKLGTGLGLFVCREIIEKHKGTLKCVSTEKETRFILVLPSQTTNNTEIRKEK